MKIQLDLAGPLRAPGGGKALEINRRRGTRLGAILEEDLDYPPEKQRFLQIVQGGRTLTPGDRVESSDPIRIFFRLGGG